MLTLAEYIAKASTKGPPRSGFILGIRMCILGMKLLGIEDPSQYHRKLVVIVETDRCLPDVVELVLHCRLGNRTLKFKDCGKMAASFLDLTQGRAFRVAARELAESNNHPNFDGSLREATHANAYTIFSDRKLFAWQPALITLALQDVPGYHAPRIMCDGCGEGISFHREIRVGLRLLCRACAGEVCSQANASA